MWRHRLRRGLAGLLVAALAATTAFVVLEPFRIAVQTLALVPELLDSGPKPLSLLVPTPERISVTYGTATQERLDLYLPRDRAERHPAILLALGVSPAPLDDPRVVRVATAIARLGLIVAVPESTALMANRIDREEPARLVEAFEVVAARPEVSPERVGIVGFSVGGSLGLLAATHPRIAGRVSFVNAFGAYGDAATLLAEVATRRIVVRDEVRAWQPGELTKRVYLGIVLDVIADPAARASVGEAISSIIAGDGPTASSYDPAVAAGLSGDALAIYQLVTTPDRATAETAIARLSEPSRELLAAISPDRAAAGLRAPVFLMHDEADNAIPFSQLGPLAAAVPPAVLRRVSAFRLFDHVEPDGGIELETLPELWELYRHLHDVLGEAL